MAGPRPRSIWLIYAVSLFAMAIAGTAYNFSSWSPDLKARLHYTQSELELVGYTGNFPGFIQPFVGVLINRYPPAVTAVIGALFLFAGYAGLAVGVTGWADWMSAPGVLAAANGSVIVGVTFIYTVVISINVLNLPEGRLGAGIAVLVMFYGLSASMFSLLYVYALQSDLLAYFVISALLTSSVALVNACTLRVVRLEGTEAAVADRRPRSASAVSSESSSVSHSSAPPSPSSFSSLSFSSSPSLLHITTTEELLTAPASPPGAPPSYVREPLTPRSLEAELSDGSMLSLFRVLLVMLRGGYFYSYFGVMFLVGGCGYMTINNTGAIVQSLNGGVADRQFTSWCILALSLGNGLGRLVMGVSDLVPIRRGWFTVMSGQC